MPKRSLRIECSQVRLEPFIGQTSFSTIADLRVIGLAENATEPDKEGQRLLWDVIRALTDDMGLADTLPNFVGFVMPESGQIGVEFKDGGAGRSRFEMVLPATYIWAQGSP
jgi:hypothetical protein